MNQLHLDGKMGVTIYMRERWRSPFEICPHCDGEREDGWLSVIKSAYHLHGRRA